jgi:hypothetical protein
MIDSIKKELESLSDEAKYKIFYSKKKEFEDIDLPTGRIAPTLKKMMLFKWDKKDIRCYFSGLHEFGHIFTEHDFYLRSDPLVEKEQELEAWEWALDNSKDSLTEPVINQISISLRSYALSEPMIESLLIPYINCSQYPRAVSVNK